VISGYHKSRVDVFIEELYKSSQLTIMRFLLRKKATATAQSETGNFHGYGVADAPPYFQRLPQE
jgi:hypothetical protein